jgi:hypothetical protein
MIDKLSDGDESALKELEESLWRAETRLDRDYMEEVLAPDFFEYGSSGRIYAREDVLGKSAEPIKARLPLEAWAARLIDGQTVQTTYITGIEDAPLRANRSSIWSRTSQGWKLRFHQGTPALDSSQPWSAGES